MLVCTSGVNAIMIRSPLFSRFVREARERFTRKDWGDLDDEDKEMNLDHFANPLGARLFAKYTIWGELLADFESSDVSDTAIYIIQEYSDEVNGQVMTILFPSEY